MLGDSALMTVQDNLAQMSYRARYNFDFSLDMLHEIKEVKLSRNTLGPKVLSSVSIQLILLLVFLRNSTSKLIIQVQEKK